MQLDNIESKEEPQEKVGEKTLNVSSLLSSPVFFMHVFGTTFIKHLGRILMNRNNRFTNGPYVLYRDTDSIINKKPIDSTEDMIIRFVRGFENRLFWLCVLFNPNIDDIFTCLISCGACVAVL